MERTNRPTQVETRTPSGRQPMGTGQASGGHAGVERGQWAEGLSQEYDNKLSGGNVMEHEDGQGDGLTGRQSGNLGGRRLNRGQGTEVMGSNGNGTGQRAGSGQSIQSGYEDGQNRGGRQQTGETVSGRGRAGYGSQRPSGGASGNGGPGQRDGTARPARYGSGGQTVGRTGYGSQGQGTQPGYGSQGQTGRPSGYGSQGQTPGPAENDSQEQLAGRTGYGGQERTAGRTGYGGQDRTAGRSGHGSQDQTGRQTGYGGQERTAGRTGYGGQDQTAGRTGYGGREQTGGSVGIDDQAGTGKTAGSIGQPGRTSQRTQADKSGRGGQQAGTGVRKGNGAYGPSGSGLGRTGQAARNNARQTKASKPKDRRPPGTSAKRGGWRGGKGRKSQTAPLAAEENRAKAVSAYEARGNRERDGHTQAVRPQGAKTPGYGSNGRKKPGSGINFLVQGSILAAAGIVVRLIGMVYRIPLAKKIGDVGNGYYNAAYSIYSILLIMSSYSLPTAVSKMVSARLAKGQYRTSTKIFRASMFYATVAGMGGFCALWFGADYFANEIIKMPYSSYALKSLAPTIWIMAYLGVLRGYFQGHSTMIPTAVSQVFEQVVNAVVSIVAASALFDMGVKSNLVFHDTEYSYAFGAAGGAIGTGAGALTALVLFLLLTMGYVPTMRKQSKRDKRSHVESYGAISRALFVTIVPIIISSAIYNISNVVDNSIFGHVMENLGESGQTASQWGVYMGRYHMLFNIPVAIANSLSSSLIPSLSRAVAGKSRRQILLKIGSAIRFSMIIAIPSAVGLTVLAEPVSSLLFSGMDNGMLIQMMTVGSSAVVFFSLSTVSNAILQGLNRMQVPIINSAVALGIHVGALYAMLTVFHMGIFSVVYANILFAGLVCILNAISIARYTRYRQEMVKTFLIPCGASAAMGGAAWGIHELCIKAGNAVSTAAAIFVAVVVYFVLLIKLKGVDAQELQGMPGGTKLLGVAKKLRLM